MKTKRGFTLIEIVIIIMVLGILTAVTIPLVSKAINNAQIKNDKILVDNINAILSEDKIHGRPKDVNEVLWILSTSELDIDEPNYKGHSFYWYEPDNIVVLVENENGNVIYPNDFTYLNINDNDDCEILIGEGEKSVDTGYKITYIINGKQVRFKGATFYNGKEEFTLPIPSLVDYTFSGWKDVNGNAVEKIPSGSEGNKTFYATLIKDEKDVEYSITYILDGGTYDGPTRYKEGEKVILGTPTKIGYEFDGWYTTSDFKDGTQVIEITANSTGNKAFYAKWKKLDVTVYTISWNLDGGNWQNEVGVTEFVAGSNINMPTPQRSGYTFLGWYEGEVKVENIGNQNYKLTAKWKKEEERDPNIFYIFYELYGGAQTNAPTEFNKEENQYVYLFTPLKRGYEFEGWYLDPEFSGDPITVIETENYSSDITLYAKWVPIEYEIVYELNNGDWSNETLEIITTYTIEDEIVLPTPIRNGYLFGAWYKEADFSGQPVTKISVGSTGTQTLYVNWGLENYNIEYVLNGGSWHNEIVGADTYNVNIEYEFPEPIYEGFVFMGWYDNENYSGDPIEDIVLGTTGHIKLYARWVKVDHYKIDLDADGGNLAGYETTTICIEFSVGTSVELPTPTRPGYKFMGWYNGETKYESPYEYAMSIKLVARWEKENPITE